MQVRPVRFGLFFKLITRGARTYELMIEKLQRKLDDTSNLLHRKEEFEGLDGETM